MHPRNRSLVTIPTSRSLGDRPRFPVVLAWVVAAGVVGLAGCANQRPIHEVRASAEEAYALGDYAQAKAEWVEVNERRPGWSDARFGLGMTELALGNNTDAIEQLWLAHGIAPERGDITDALAEAMLADGRNAELAKFLFAQTRQSGKVEDYMRLGLFSQRLGDADAAERALRIAAMVDRGFSVEPQLALANLYESIGDKPNALRRLSMAGYLQPQNPEIAQRIRNLGEVPGLTFHVEPEERLLPPIVGTMELDLIDPSRGFLDESHTLPDPISTVPESEAP